MKIRLTIVLFVVIALTGSGIFAQEASVLRVYSSNGVRVVLQEL